MVTHIGNYSIYYHFINEVFIQLDKPIVIMLHDGLGSVKQWKDFPEMLSGKLELPVLVYDRLGHGMSSGKTEIENLDFLKHEAGYYLPELINALELQNKKIILFGHSDGATIALLYAALCKRQIMGVISLAAHVMLEDITKKGVLEMKKLYEIGVLKKKLAYYHGNKTDEMFCHWANAWTDECSLTWNIFTHLEKISSPVLAIQGRNDEYGTELQIQNMVSKIPAKVEKHILDACGHIPHIQQQEKVLNYTKKFVDSLFKMSSA